MFLQMLQFRLGGKTTITSCEGHKEELLCVQLSTKEYRKRYAIDQERLHGSNLHWVTPLSGIQVVTLLIMCQFNCVRYHSAMITLG